MSKLPISDFLTQRLAEYDSKFELRSGTGFEKLFFKPIQFMLQPFVDEADIINTSQSLRQILATDDPDAFNEESVDANISNLFVYRAEGAYSTGVARVYYNEAVDRAYPTGGASFLGTNDKTYSNVSAYSITKGEMASQIEGGLFYFDITVKSDDRGEDTELEINNLVTLQDDVDVVTVTNKNRISGGLSREKNTALIDRTKNSIAVRDLVTGKGINAILFENFQGQLSELQPIGLGDDEMMRDILFNTHIGGKVDCYVKTSSIQTGREYFIGMLVDTTRQAFTTTVVQPEGTNWYSLGNVGVDRSGSKNPVVQEIKATTVPEFSSSIDMSSPLDLSNHEYVKLIIDGISRTIKISGPTVTATSREEIISYINSYFGYEVAFKSGIFLKLKGTVGGKNSELVIDNPDYGTNAILQVFGIDPVDAPYVISGDGPITFVEGTNYEIDDAGGKFRRKIAARVVPVNPSDPLPTGGKTTTNVYEFKDTYPGIFAPVNINDILIITTGVNAKEYRILAKSDGILTLDSELAADSSMTYYIVGAGIKDLERVYIQYYYNPLSIDIGKYIKLDALGRTRGIRPGRSDMTISDVAFLRIKQIEVIDPLSLEPLGIILNGAGGYGSGGFGEGPYGVGGGAEYYMVVNEPTARFSAFEDSYIVINQGYQGLSLAVDYEYVPEIEDMHNFARSYNERVLDGDVLMKHYLPAYVSGTIDYVADSTDSSIPDNTTLQGLVKDFITSIKSGENLEYSDIIQFILKQIDPYNRYTSKISIFTLSAYIHNTDGSTTGVTGKDSLSIPELDPFPKYTTRPLSSRITHWIADNIILRRG
jgi:hypothetical protein